MDKKSLASALEYAADLIDVLGEGDMRAKAYRYAARGVEQAPLELAQLRQANFKGVKGVGASLAPMLVNIVDTGQFAYLDELESALPAGVLDFFKVSGLGPKRIRALWQSDIHSLEQLEQACVAQQVRAISGFGAKTEQTLLVNVQYALSQRQRVLLPVGLAASQLVLQDLTQAGIEAYVAGSIARGLETIGNIDIVAVASPQQVKEACADMLTELKDNVWNGYSGGLALRVVCCTPDTLGSTRLQHTASAAWLSGTTVPKATTLEQAFAAIGSQPSPLYWLEPEHRNLEPQTPITQSQMLGLIHNHTTYSDGTGTLRQMALAAQAKGYSYIVISDHSQTAVYAGGLTVEKLQQQWHAIDELNAEFAPFKILKGIESDILTNGDLDYPDHILDSMDVVIGSLHSNFGLSAAAQTERLIRAIAHPALKILGHPTARLLLRRKGVEADWNAVLETALHHNKAIEFNCHPARLDLDWRLLMQYPVKVSLGPDAHSLEGIDLMRYGIHFANKAGLPLERIVNSWTPQQLSTLGK